MIQPLFVSRSSKGQRVEFKPESSGRPDGRWRRFIGAGFELAGVAFVFGLIGYAIDRSLGNVKQVATAIAMLIGFSLGLMRFVLLASKENARQRELDEHHKVD